MNLLFKNVIGSCLIVTGVVACQGGGGSSSSASPATSAFVPALPEAKSSYPQGIEYSTAGDVLLKHSYSETGMKCIIDSSVGSILIRGADEVFPSIHDDPVTQGFSSIQLNIPLDKLPPGDFSNLKIEWTRQETPVFKDSNLREPIMLDEGTSTFSRTSSGSSRSISLFASTHVPSKCIARLSLKDNVMTGDFSCGQLDGVDGSGFRNYSSEGVTATFGCKLEPTQ